MVTKEQRRQYKKNWENKHPKEAKAAQDRWREKHKDEINTKAATWRANNPDKVKAYHKKKYHQKTRDELTPEQLKTKRKYAREWYNTHRIDLLKYSHDRYITNRDPNVKVRKKPLVKYGTKAYKDMTATNKREAYPAKYRHRFRNGEASKCKRWAINDMQASDETCLIMSEYLIMGLSKYPELIIPIDTCQL